MSSESTAIVVDLGSKDIKAGYAYAFPTDEEPRLVTPAAVTVSANGVEGSAPRLVRPIQAGIITDWEALETLLHYALYDQLGWVQGAEGGLLMVEPVFTSRDERERLLQLAFEVFNVSSYFATDSAVASLYAVGRSNGIVVDVGYEKVDVVPVVEGLVQSTAAVRLPFGGRHLTAHMAHLLRQSGLALGQGAAAEEAAEAIKLKFMRVLPLNAGAEATPAGAGPEEAVTTHTLPDGQTITLRSEGAQVGEALITPQRLGLQLPPLADAVATAGMVTTLHGERDARKALIENIMVCGGGAAVSGLSERLLAEVRQLTHPSLPPALAPMPNYMPPQTAERAAWMGGAVLAKVAMGTGGGTSAAAQLQQPVTKADYDELGPAVVHRKCS